MKTTENFSLKQPEAADFYNVADFNENAAVVDGELQKAAVHMGDGSRHVTAAEKAQWNQQAAAGTAALDAHKADKTAHVAVSERVHSLTHVKNGTVHALMGLSGKTGQLSVKFKATAAFATGDSFTVDGTAYTAKLTNGRALPKEAFVAGVLCDCILDTAGKTVNFKSAGEDKTALAAAIGSPATVEDSLDQMASAINSGKSILATAITNKGIGVGANATFAQFASSVDRIRNLKSQEGTARNILGFTTVQVTLPFNIMFAMVDGMTSGSDAYLNGRKYSINGNAGCYVNGNVLTVSNSMAPVQNLSWSAFGV